MPSFRTSNFDKENNEIELRLNLDLFDEKRQPKSTRSPSTTIRESSTNLFCLVT